MVGQTATNLEKGVRSVKWYIWVGFWPVGQWFCERPPNSRLYWPGRGTNVRQMKNGFLSVWPKEGRPPTAVTWNSCIAIVVPVTSSGMVLPFWSTWRMRARVVLWIVHSVHSLIYSFMSCAVRTYHPLLFKKEQQDAKPYHPNFIFKLYMLFFEGWNERPCH